MKDKKETQIVSKWIDTYHKIYAKKKVQQKKRKKKRVQWNELKGEEQEETVEFFSYYLSLV